MVLNRDTNADCTDNILPNSFPSTSDDFIASLHRFLAANRIAATGTCTMNILQQDTSNKVVVSFNVEAEIVNASAPITGRPDTVSPLPSGSGTTFGHSMAEPATPSSLEPTSFCPMELSAPCTCNSINRCEIHTSPRTTTGSLGSGPGTAALEDPNASGNIFDYDTLRGMDPRLTQSSEYYRVPSDDSDLAHSTATGVPVLAICSTTQVDLQNAGLMVDARDQQDLFPGNSTPTRNKKKISRLGVALSILRTDYLEYLATELSRWVQWGLWEHTSHLDVLTPVEPGIYSKLQAAYNAVCLLQTRIGDDAIRCRIALLELHCEYSRACSIPQLHDQSHSAGRGRLTSIIDQTMPRIYREWDSLDDVQQRARRTQFHNHKRHGKRWEVLVDGLGKGILFLASTKAAHIVHNTAFTFDDLETIVKHVQNNPSIMVILNEVAPLAEKLCNGTPCSTYDAEILLKKLGA